MFSVWECLILLEKEVKGYLHREKNTILHNKKMKGKLEGAIAPSPPVLIPSYVYAYNHLLYFNYYESDLSLILNSCTV